ncbi:S66 peptidase family protein [Hydrococcus rivularis]|uniref:S66 peptidase family protein n=1 Tax=Hydrococcus rivularis TaxID=1616834 RepID=UPI000AC33A10|nr:LD-carboxypeptidase [Hydrococcus rivularis]
MTKIAAYQLPQFLKPGDLVRVVATSGALKELEAFKKGVEIWRSRGYRVELGNNWNIRYGYLAGTDTQRRNALSQAWQDPECKAILCARGGYGSARLLEDWRWEVGSRNSEVGSKDVPAERLYRSGGSGRVGDSESGRLGDKEEWGNKGENSLITNPKSAVLPEAVPGACGGFAKICGTQSPHAAGIDEVQAGSAVRRRSTLHFQHNGDQNPKWIVGFSDVTGLLWSLAAIGIGGVHGSVLTTLASEPDWSIQRLFDCLEGRPLPPLIGKGWGEGKTTGILLPANLTVATHLLGTFVQPSFDGAILALEDVAEAPYRIDRMLTQWRMTGAFRGVRGIALGRFSRCDPPMGSASWSIEEVLRDRLGDLGIPIVSDLPFGHDGVNAALPVGRIARLDAEQGTLDILDNSNEFQEENDSSQ